MDVLESAFVILKKSVFLKWIFTFGIAAILYFFWNRPSSDNNDENNSKYKSRCYLFIFIFVILDVERKSNFIEERKEDEDDEENQNLLSPLLEEHDHIPYCGKKVNIDESGETFYHVMNDRRSIRKFDPNRTIDMKVIEKCILTAGKIRFSQLFFNYLIIYDDLSKELHQVVLILNLGHSV